MKVTCTKSTQTQCLAWITHKLTNTQTLVSLSFGANEFAAYFLIWNFVSWCLNSVTKYLREWQKPIQLAKVEPKLITFLSKRKSKPAQLLEGVQNFYPFKVCRNHGFCDFTSVIKSRILILCDGHQVDQIDNRNEKSLLVSSSWMHALFNWASPLVFSVIVSFVISGVEFVLVLTG